MPGSFQLGDLPSPGPPIRSPEPVTGRQLFFLCRRDGATQPPAVLGTLGIG